ncbi:MarR family winged helix-turn-helix transcriptional regulator [Pseudonocardia sp. KRD291]|uniref:MarR family winged helix-turn-helix transcriptional regulator n=1 Tax=Pseudonocardia sp. KRD291 TaxID=2792007 RepID=UPI001C4A4C2A|nr:MarR family winged helix-turn-helix transcriptional regulator [Pseudonocardia sp. KRD291]MBW0105562.1 winged helix-turn-helix transcriptional regulator [Pseudonocardia sp. KRD291]
MQQSDPEDALVDAVMTASRALLAVAARSLAAVDEDVTLPQYRTLVVLAQYGARRPADLAASLAVTPSTATRMCDRLVAKGLIDRERADDDRRAVAVALTRDGEDLVRNVTGHRREELGRLLGAMPQDRRQAVVEGLRSFSEAAGEVAETEWAVAPTRL